MLPSTTSNNTVEGNAPASFASSADVQIMNQENMN